MKRGRESLGEGGRMTKGRESLEDDSMVIQGAQGVHGHLQKAREMMTQRRKDVSIAKCKLPSPSEYFNSPEWELPDLVEDCVHLNEAKNRLDHWDRREWEKAAAIANRADQVREKLRKDFHVEMGTIAWAKMYETIVSCDMMPRDSPALPDRERGKPGVVSIHLCEAPGAFIAATNHFVKTHRQNWNWDWMAVSLNPWNEANDMGAMIDDDALISQTKDHWCFGADDTGDIRRIENIRDIWRRGRELCGRMRCEGAMMVTADGAVDTSHDPNRQEFLTASLHYCEVVAALGVLARGGNFVWKGFTLYEHPSICSLYLMGCVFQEVYVYKPATSKPANSEVYVVGKGYKGIPLDVLELLLSNCGDDIFNGRAMFPLSLLPEDFLATARNAAKFFGGTTAEAIDEAISLHGLPGHARAELRQAQEAFAREWCERLQVLPLNPSLFLAPHVRLDGRRNNTSKGTKRELTGTLADRQDQFAKRKNVYGAGQAAAPGRLTAAGPGRPGGPGGFGAGEGGGGMGGEEGMQVSSKALGLMAKMGFKAGQGLGKAGQGMSSALEVAGNMRRAGLGLGAGGDGGAAGGGGAAADWSPAPDTAMLNSPGPLPEEEVASWPAPRASLMLDTVKKSKLLPNLELLVSLREVRQGCRDAAAAAGLTPKGICRHTGAPCVAPRRRAHSSRAYWKLAALDTALGLVGQVAATAQQSECLPSLLDLSFRGCGASEYVGSAGPDWRMTLLDSPESRSFAQTDPRVALASLGHADPTTLGRDALCSVDSSQQVAQAASGCWLVLGDLGSARRATQPDAAAPPPGVMEAEFSQPYQQRLLWEVATAMGALAPGGSLVLRLADCLTMFTAGVMYLLNRSFSQLCVLKPFGSCACSAERFVVAMGFMDTAGVARSRVLAGLAELQVAAEEAAEAAAAADGAVGLGTAAAGAPPPPRVLKELVPSEVCVSNRFFLNYLTGRTDGLAQREVRLGGAVLAQWRQEGGPTEPSEEEREALAAQAERRLRGEVEELPPAADGPPDDLKHKYGGMFTRGGGIGSQDGHDSGVGSRPGLGGHPPPPPPHGGRRGPGGQVGGGGGSVRLFARHQKGVAFVCHVVCEGPLDNPAAEALASSDLVVDQYRYRDDFDPPQHYQGRLVLLPAQPQDAAKLARVMEVLANTGAPGRREKVAVVQARGTQDWALVPSACLDSREAVDPEQGGLPLWY